MRRIALVSLLCLAVAGTAKGEGGIYAEVIAAIDAAIRGRPASRTREPPAGIEGGRTPLHLAAQNGHAAAIKALLIGLSIALARCQLAGSSVRSFESIATAVGSNGAPGSVCAASITFVQSPGSFARISASRAALSVGVRVPLMT